MIDTTALSYFVLGVVVYYTTLFLMSLRRRPVPKPEKTDSPLMVLVVPARNEELVLDETLKNLTTLDYADYRILLMNDGSSDRTSEIAHRWEMADPRVMVVDRGVAIAGRGKSAVLNHAFQVVNAMVDARDGFVGSVSPRSRAPGYRRCRRSTRSAGAENGVFVLRRWSRRAGPDRRQDR